MTKRMIIITVVAMVGVMFFIHSMDKQGPEEGEKQATDSKNKEEMKAEPSNDAEEFRENQRVSANKEMEDIIADRVEKMSLDEKIGQMIFSGVDGTEMTPETKRTIQSYHVGGIILFGANIESGRQTVHFLNQLKEANAENPAPLLLGVDEEGGQVTRMPEDMKSLPSSRAIGALNNPDTSYHVGRILGKQMNALGFNLDFAPIFDVDSNPNNPVIGDRSFGDNPKRVTELGIETMKGIQDEGVLSVMKHFPGHGDTDVDSHFGLPQVDKSKEELAALELIPFQKAIREGADVAMVAHILLPQLDASYPASLSKEVVTGMLREAYDFDGVVVTDDLTMEAITDQYSVEDAALQSVKAGSDLLLFAHDSSLIAKVFNRLKAAVKEGEIDVERIDKSIERILTVKRHYQLSDEETFLPPLQPINEKVEDIWKEVNAPS